MTDTYAYEITGPGSNLFGVIDLNTGVFTSLGSMGQTLGGLGSYGGEIYGGAYHGTTLYSIDTSTGALTAIGDGNIGGGYGLFGSTTSGLYTVGWDAYLYSINPASGAGTKIGPTGLSISGVMGMSTGSSTLYVTHNNSLYALNTTNGSATFIGTTNEGESGFGALVSIGETLYGGAYGSSIPDIYTLDPQTGAATFVAASPSTPFSPGVAGFWGLAPEFLSISITTPIAGDNIVNKTEATAGFAISGSESGADGQIVTVKIVNDANQVVDSYTTTAASSAWTVIVTQAQAQALADGSYTVKADVSDAAGNPATEATQAITVDETAPAVAITSAGGLTNHPTQTVLGTVDVADAGTTVSILDASTVLGTAVVQSDGTWSKSVTLTGDGTHTLTAQDTDAAGNTGTSNAVIFTLDTTPPTVAISSEILSHRKVTLSGTTAEANDSISVYDGSTLLGTTTTDSNGTWKFTTAKVSNSVHAYTATATDLAGNVGHSSNEAILGSSRADILVGTTGNDIVIGNGGNDKITGGIGADVLTGSGKVTFIYNAESDSTPASYDTITNFHGRDTIDFTNVAGIDANHGVPTFQGNLTGPGNLILNAHSVAYIEVGGNTEVLVNTTNAAEIVTTSDVSAANMEIVLVGIHHHLTSSDFHHI
jgi:hypothetical protein